MHRWLLMVVILGVGAAGLSACEGTDPHYAPYWTWPGGDPAAIKQYSTNLYPAPDAPPLSSGPGAGGARR